MKASHRLCVFLLGVSVPLFAQQTPSQSTVSAGPSTTTNPPPSAHPNSGNTNPLITLDVVVTNKSGTPQTGLSQQDFVLLDNKTPQKILTFRAIEEPVPALPPAEIVLSLDTVNTGTQTVSDMRLQITKYLQRNGGKLTHPTSIVVFSNSGLRNLGEATLDGNALSTVLAGKDVIGLRTVHQAAGAHGAAERLVNLSAQPLFDRLV